MIFLVNLAMYLVTMDLVDFLVVVEEADVVGKRVEQEEVICALS